MACSNLSQAPAWLSDWRSTRKVQTPSSCDCNSDCSANSRTSAAISSALISPCTTEAQWSPSGVASMGVSFSTLTLGAMGAGVGINSTGFTGSASATALTGTTGAGTGSATARSTGGETATGAARRGSGCGFFGGSTAPRDSAVPVTRLKGSSRSNTMVSAAYSSGASPNSPRPCKHRL